uniref:Uncharacterized protein n=1 Tax=Arundo donax TaxID=35708 RepID=A0A0A9G358_ARUDO
MNWLFWLLSGCYQLGVRRVLLLSIRLVWLGGYCRQVGAVQSSPVGRDCDGSCCQRFEPQPCLPGIQREFNYFFVENVQDLLIK